MLLRRLRDRLGIPPERFQVICATASFKDKEYAPQFGAQLSGIPPETFEPVTGTLDLRSHSAAGSDHDAALLASIKLDEYYKADSDTARLAVLKPLLDLSASEGRTRG